MAMLIAASGGQVLLAVVIAAVVIAVATSLAMSPRSPARISWGTWLVVLTAVIAAALILLPWIRIIPVGVALIGVVVLMGTALHFSRTTLRVVTVVVLAAGAIAVARFEASSDDPEPPLSLTEEPNEVDLEQLPAVADAVDVLVVDPSGEARLVKLAQPPPIEGKPIAAIDEAAGSVVAAPVASAVALEQGSPAGVLPGTRRSLGVEQPGARDVLVVAPDGSAELLEFGPDHLTDQLVVVDVASGTAGVAVRGDTPPRAFVVDFERDTASERKDWWIAQMAAAPPRGATTKRIVLNTESPAGPTLQEAAPAYDFIVTIDPGTGSASVDVSRLPEAVAVLALNVDGKADIGEPDAEAAAPDLVIDVDGNLGTAKLRPVGLAAGAPGAPIKVGIADSGQTVSLLGDGDAESDFTSVVTIDPAELPDDGTGPVRIGVEGSEGTVLGPLQDEEDFDFVVTLALDPPAVDTTALVSKYGTGPLRIAVSVASNEAALLGSDDVVVTVDLAEAEAGLRAPPAEDGTPLLVRVDEEGKATLIETADADAAGKPIVVVGAEGATVITVPAAGGSTAASVDDLEDRVRGGGDALVSSATRWFVDPDEDTRLGAVGWLVLLAAGLIGYRRLEIVNGRRLAGPITIDEFTGTDNKAWKTRMEQTVATEIRGLSNVPGASTEGGSLTTVLGEVGSLGAGTWVAPLVKVARAVGFPTRGYSAAPHYDSPPVPGATTANKKDENTKDEQKEETKKTHRVTVTVRDKRSGKVLAVKRLVDAESEEGAVDRAAYFVARFALERSSTVPSWAHWRSDEGRALALYHEVIDRPAKTVEAGELKNIENDRARLEAARTLSPGNALIRVELAHAYDILGQHLDSLEQHLDVRGTHPRQLQARYRLAVSLDFVASKLETTWLATGIRQAQRKSIVDRMGEYLIPDPWIEPRVWRTWRRDGRRDGFSALLGDARYRADLITVLGHVESGANLRKRLVSNVVATQPDVTVVRLTLLHQARRELEVLQRLYSTPRAVWRARRQSERQYWLPIVLRSHDRRAAWARVEVARLKLEASRIKVLLDHDHTQRRWKNLGDELDRLRPRVDRIAERGWNAQYNAACFHAARALIYRTRRDRHLGATGTPDDIKDLNEKIADATDVAIAHLRRALLDPDSRFPVPPIWMKKDPDLQPLRQDPQFKRWLAQLSATEPTDD